MEKGENIILLNSSLQAIAGFLLKHYTFPAMEKVGGLNDSLIFFLFKDKLMGGGVLRIWLGVRALFTYAKEEGSIPEPT